MQLATNVTPLRPPAANDNEPDPYVQVTNWEGTPIPARKWFVPALIPSRTVTLLTGDGGLGKSLLALQIGRASALNMPTLGLDPLPGKVLYVGAEDEQDEFHRRMADILTGFGKSFSDLRWKFLLLPLAEGDAMLAAPDRVGKMQPTALMADLIERIMNFRPGLVVLDTSADLFGGDEIKRSQVRQFVAMLRSIAIGADCAVLLLSHPSVAGIQTGTGTSGSTAWNNSVRARLYLTADTGEDADPNTRVLTTMKSNYGAKAGALRLRWLDGAFVADSDRRPDPAASLLSKQADAVFVSLLSAFNRTGINVGPNRSVTYAPTAMAKHPDAAGIQKRTLELAMHRLLAAGTIKVVTEGPPTKRRSRFWVTAEDVGPSIPTVSQSP